MSSCGNLDCIQTVERHIVPLSTKEGGIALHAVERNFDAIKEGPIPVEHINRLARTAVATAVVFVNHILSRSQGSNGRSRDMRTGAAAVAMERPEPSFN